MKKFTSILLMLFFALSGLFAANMKGGEVFYLTPHTTWNSDNARYAIYFFNNSTGKNTWASMSKVEGESNLWTGTVPAGDWANLIFCRMNPSATTNGWGNNVFWGGQTQDLTWDGTNNWFKVDSSKDAWNKPAGTWSTYTPPTPDPEPEPEPDPEDPDTPVDPDPEDPDTPVDPDPEDPDQPVDPEDPDQPVDPEDPDQPVDPEDPDTPVEPATTITISFASDWEAANFYAWTADGEVTATWPGDAMTAADGKFTYELTLPEGDYSFIINNGNGTQTVNNEGVAESTCFVLDENKAGKWTLAVSANCEATDPKPIETSYVLMGVGGDWNTGIAMTPNPDNADEYVVMGQAISAATDAVKVVVFSAEGTIYCGTVKEGSVAYTQDDMQNIVLADGTYDFYYSISENAIYIGESLTPDPDQPVDPEDPDQPVDPEDPDTPVDPEPVMITLYYVNNQGWSSVNAYAWGENPIATWPGEAATKTDLTAKGYDVYSYTFDSSLAANIIFNGDGNQTADLEFDPATPYFYIDQWYASLEDIEATSVEELAAYNIYATDGTIYADCEFAIYNLGGIDVTAQNGSLEGNYVVKTQKGSLLISVW